MSTDDNKLTPMMRQYREAKAQIPPDAILLFRLGDFYEMFFEDAEKASAIMELVLTKRAGIPMCGAGDPKQAETLKDIPIWAIHGAKDPTVPVQGSQNMATALENVGAEYFKYTELPDHEHDVWNYIAGPH